jgi:ribosomal protein S18 acetylase RimI-like enzyme
MWKLIERIVRLCTAIVLADDASVNWDDVAYLFKSVGWGRREPEDLRAAFSKSTFKCFAFDDAKLVGFGRTIDDGRYMATIVDMIVRPEYQRRGIGHQIMQNLQARLTGFLYVTLTAVSEAQPFYEKLGWRKMKTGMIFPRDEEQVRRNCK